MKVWMAFNGGASYAPCYYEDIEAFDSLRSAMRAFERRTAGCDRRYPCVDETAEAWIWTKTKPTQEESEYPERIMMLGARGAVVVMSA
jgi:hypothetical protein